MYVRIYILFEYCLSTMSMFIFVCQIFDMSIHFLCLSMYILVLSYISSTQIAGGLLARKYGGKLVLGLGLLVNSILSLLTPLAAVTSYYVLIASRLLQGFTQVLGVIGKRVFKPKVCHCQT